jgi:hypothetical protein
MWGHRVIWLPRKCGGSVPLVLDLHIAHERFGSSSDPSIFEQTTPRRRNAILDSSTTNRSARRASNGAAAPSSLPSPSSLPQPPLFPRDAPAAAPAHTEFLPRRYTYMVRLFCFPTSELFDTERLFELRDFRIARVMPKGGI